MTLGWLVLIGLFVGVVLGAVRDRRNPSAREVLDRRLAAGEINLDDYERARMAMARESADHSPTGPPAAA
jgi:uncharacterized membrane protein